MSDLRERVACAIRRHFFPHRNDENVEERWLEAADAVLPVVEEAAREAMAEVARLTEALALEVDARNEAQEYGDRWRVACNAREGRVRAAEVENARLRKALRAVRVALRHSRRRVEHDGPMETPV